MICKRLYSGAESGTRTRDLLITNELLYQLSYFGNVFRWKRLQNYSFPETCQTKTCFFSEKLHFFYPHTPSSRPIETIWLLNSALFIIINPTVPHFLSTKGTTSEWISLPSYNPEKQITTGKRNKKKKKNVFWKNFRQSPFSFEQKCVYLHSELWRDKRVWWITG